MFGLKKDRYAADNRLLAQFFAATNGQRISTCQVAAPYLYHPVAGKACEAAPRRFS